MKFSIYRRVFVMGCIISDDCSESEILSKVAQTTAALAKLEGKWNDKNIRLISYIYLPTLYTFMRLDFDCKSQIKNPTFGNERLSQTTEHLLHHQ